MSDCDLPNFTLQKAPGMWGYLNLYIGNDFLPHSLLSFFSFAFVCV